MEHTWLAYSLDAEGSRDTDASLARVRRHYQEAASYELIPQGTSSDEATGMVVWAEPDPAGAWPVWTQAGSLDIASVHVPTGWQRVVGDSSSEYAPTALARALWAEPERSGKLNGPFIVAVRDRDSGRLAIVNDLLGTAGLYEMQMSDGWVWSNRLGALPVFAGARPIADPRSWSLFAATGWFVGDSSPIAGARRMPGGTVVTVDSRGQRHRVIDELGSLVRPRPARINEAVRVAGDQMSQMAKEVGGLWPSPARVDLSGGQDSRVGAAAVVANGVDAIFRTENVYPGEPEVVAELLAAAPGRLRHRFVDVTERTRTGSLHERLAALHLAHDGVRWPVAVREPLLRAAKPVRSAAIVGHGGETARGFYYSKKGDRERRSRYAHEVRQRGILERLLRSAHVSGNAGREELYELFRAEAAIVLAEGREWGLEGLSLLDYFYLRERFRSIQDLDTGTSRVSLFTNPAFVRAAFDLTPEQRLDAELHKRLVASFIPAWQAVPYYKPRGGRDKVFVRRRIWEPPDAEAMEAMLERRSIWAPLYRPKRVLRMWREAREGTAPSAYEQVFERIAWRVAYEDHLAKLAKAGT